MQEFDDFEWTFATVGWQASVSWPAYSSWIVMGTLVHLAIGNLEVDYGRNNNFSMHGALFQRSDAGLVPWDFASSEESLVEGAARPLGLVARRLDLLGYTIRAARHEYDAVARQQDATRPPISFDQLAHVLASLDIDAAAADYHTDFKYGEFFARECFDRRKLSRIRRDRESAKYVFGDIMENLHPYALLRLLAENPGCQERLVSWNFGGVVDSGWVERDTILADLGRTRQFLIVTEGSSDARILAHALKLLRPEIADFFYFVDMEEGYPFTGTGNLHRFCHGLASIRIENRVLVLYDNDAEGASRYEASRRLRLPSNLRIVRLPALEALQAFATEGPSGSAMADINGKAAAIECYLDLSYKERSTPRVQWTSFNAGAQCYQGELIGKERYTRRFLGLRALPPEYDASKLNAVLDMLVHHAVAAAEDALLGDAQGLKKLSERF